VYEGQLSLESVFLHQILGLLDALALAGIKLVDHFLDTGQVLGIERGCLNPRSLPGQNWLRGKPQIGTAFFVGSSTCWGLEEDHFDGGNQPVDIFEDLCSMAAHKMEAMGDACDMEQMGEEGLQVSATLQHVGSAVTEKNTDPVLIQVGVKLPQNCPKMENNQIYPQTAK